MPSVFKILVAQSDKIWLFGPVMDASAKTLSRGKQKSDEDWTVVLPRSGKQKRNASQIITPEVCEQEQKAWVPTNDAWNLEKEVKLMHKMQSYIEKVEKSQFCKDFLDQLDRPEMAEEFLRVRGSQDKMQMVIYGIGSIGSFDPPRLQLSMALLMKRRFSWIGDVEVFDPIISFTESKVLESLGCSVLSVNEHCQRQVSKPTLFFMPHCDAHLYDNLLLANSRADSLNQMIVFGNSFSEYERMESFRRISKTVPDAKKRQISAIKRFSKEYPIVFAISDDYSRAFNSLSWHFFNLYSKAFLESIFINLVF